MNCTEPNRIIYSVDVEDKIYRQRNSGVYIKLNTNSPNIIFISTQQLFITDLVLLHWEVRYLSNEQGIVVLS